MNEFKEQEAASSAKKLPEAFRSPLVFAQILDETKCQINQFRSGALKTERGYAFDYAIGQLDARSVSSSALASPYMVHHGERHLLYEFFTIILVTLGV